MDTICQPAYFKHRCQGRGLPALASVQYSVRARLHDGTALNIWIFAIVDIEAFCRMSKVQQDVQIKESKLAEVYSEVKLLQVHLLIN